MPGVVTGPLSRRVDWRRLRADLLDAVLHQPLAGLSDQAVGEILDRVDDDTHEIGALLRQNAWMVVRLALASGPLLIVAELSAAVHARFAEVVRLEGRITLRTGVVLHSVLAIVAVVGVFLVSAGLQSTAAFVTLFLVTTTFVGQIDRVAQHVPDLQAGVGALIRLRRIFAVDPEPSGGDPLPKGPLTLELRRLHFAYPEGSFALEVVDPQSFLRPGRVAHVAQVPRSVTDARLGVDVAEAGGTEALVGHRGVRLSGGQVQRLALARALATDSEVLLADDVSSALDATTEVELWESLRARESTVIGATTKRSALRRADRVVVLVEGRVAAQGPWSELEGEWGHLAG